MLACLIFTLLVTNYLGYYIIKDEVLPSISMMNEINDASESVSYLLFPFIGLFFKVSCICRLHRIIVPMFINYLFYYELLKWSMIDWIHIICCSNVSRPLLSLIQLYWDPSHWLSTFCHCLIVNWMKYHSKIYHPYNYP